MTLLTKQQIEALRDGLAETKLAYSSAGEGLIYIAPVEDRDSAVAIPVRDKNMGWHKAHPKVYMALIERFNAAPDLMDTALDALARHDDALARLAAAEAQVAALTEALKGIAGYNDMPGVEWRERHPSIAEKFDISRRAKLGAGHALATYARERLAALATVTPPADTTEGA